MRPPSADPPHAPRPSFPPTHTAHSYSSVMHLVPADAPILALGLVIADAFLLNATVWAFAHVRRALGGRGPHARAHAEAARAAKAADAIAEATWRAAARSAADAAAVEAEIQKRRDERERRLHAHAVSAEALDLDVYLSLIHI